MWQGAVAKVRHAATLPFGERFWRFPLIFRLACYTCLPGKEKQTGEGVKGHLLFYAAPQTTPLPRPVWRCFCVSLIPNAFIVHKLRPLKSSPLNTATPTRRLPPQTHIHTYIYIKRALRTSSPLPRLFRQIKKLLSSLEKLFRFSLRFLLRYDKAEFHINCCGSGGTRCV